MSKTTTDADAAVEKFVNHISRHSEVNIVGETADLVFLTGRARTERRLRHAESLAAELNAEFDTGYVGHTGTAFEVVFRH